MLAKLLQLDPTGENRFLARHHQQNFRNTLFGGQVLAQGLMAAGLTVPGRPPNSLHAYFLRAGSAGSPVEYQVEILRDGNSVSNRAVNAVQDGDIIFTMQASFHAAEPGYEHQQQYPRDSVDPQTLKKTAGEDLHLAQRASQALGSTPIEIAPYDHAIFDAAPSPHANVRFWVRSASTLGDGALAHYCALAFASDIGLLAAALLPHDTSLFAGKIFPASMDHALWFHQPPNFHQWHQYLTTSPWAGSGRALCQGALYDANNLLVASVSQEGLIRRVSD